MSYPAAPSPSTQSAPQAAAPSKKPGTLVTAMVIAIVTGVSIIVNGVMILMYGIDLIKEILADFAGVGQMSDADLDSLAQLAGTSVAEWESTLNTRAYVALAIGVVLVALALAMNKAATWARVLLTIVYPIAMILAFVIAANEGNGLMALLDLVAILCAIVGIVFTWLPANGRYGKAMKQA